jgi:hypothetical protein
MDRPFSGRRRVIRRASRQKKSSSHHDAQGVPLWRHPLTFVGVWPLWILELTDLLLRPLLYPLRGVLCLRPDVARRVLSL